MRRFLGLASATLLAAASPAGAEPWQLERSDVQTVAASNGTTYRLMIAWPDGECPARGWPFLWMLDGEDNFTIAALTARRLAKAGERTGVEPGVVVGVDSGTLGRRVFDYTPAVSGYAIAPGMPAAGLKTGGADAFLDILENELRPLLAGRCPVDHERQTLAGHSFGGLLALHALSSGRSFSAYAAISPSLWFGDGAVASRAGGDERLLLASRTAEPRMGKGGTAMARAERWCRAGRDVEYLSLEGHGHGTTMLAAMGAIVEIAFGRTR